MERHIELYLPYPTGAFCLLLDDADNVLDFDERDENFWKKGLQIFDGNWKRLPCCASQTIWPKGVEIQFEAIDGTVNLGAPVGEKLEIRFGAQKIQGLLNITIIQ